MAAWLASIGSEMQSVAVGWELYERTDSALSLGLVGLVGLRLWRRRLEQT